MSAELAAAVEAASGGDMDALLLKLRGVIDDAHAPPQVRAAAAALDGAAVAAQAAALLEPEVSEDRAKRGIATLLTIAEADLPRANAGIVVAAGALPRLASCLDSSVEHIQLGSMSAIMTIARRLWQQQQQKQQQGSGAHSSPQPLEEVFAAAVPPLCQLLGSQSSPVVQQFAASTLKAIFRSGGGAGVRDELVARRPIPQLAQLMRGGARPPGQSGGGAPPPHAYLRSAPPAAQSAAAFLLAHLLLADRGAVGAAAAAGAPEAVAEMLARPELPPEARYNAAGCAMAMASDEACCAALARAGAVGGLIKVVESGSGSGSRALEDVAHVAKATAALLDMAEHGQAEQMVCLGAVPAAVLALRACNRALAAAGGEDEEAREVAAEAAGLACRLLSTCSMGCTDKHMLVREMASAGAAAQLVQLLRSQHVGPAAAELALHAAFVMLAPGPTLPGCLRSLVAAGLVEAVPPLLARGDPQSALGRTAVQTLSVVALAEEGSEELRGQVAAALASTPGALGRLVEVVAVVAELPQPAGAYELLRAMGPLGVALEGRGAQQEFQPSGAATAEALLGHPACLRALLRAMQGQLHAPSPPVASSAAQLLCLVAMQPAMRDRLTAAGVVPPLGAALREEGHRALRDDSLPARTLFELTKTTAGVAAVVEAGLVPLLADLVREGLAVPAPPGGGRRPGGYVSHTLLHIMGCPEHAAALKAAGVEATR
jgi:hypothetical protein